MLSNKAISTNIQDYDFSKKKIAIVQSLFNQDITDNLLAGCFDALELCQVKVSKQDVFKVPGAFEIPYMVKHITKLKKYDAILCFGCLIKGDTDHYDSTRIAVTNELCRLSVDLDLPIVNGVLNVNNEQQAYLRCGVSAGGINLGAHYTKGLMQM